MKADYVLLSLEVDGEKRVFVSEGGKKKSLIQQKPKLKKLIRSAEQIHGIQNITMYSSEGFSYKITNKDFAMYSGTLKGNYMIEVFPNYISIRFL